MAKRSKTSGSKILDEACIKFYGQKGPYAFLSNFYPVEMEIDSRKWPTVEHYYQAMKSLSYPIQEDIRLGLPLGTAPAKLQPGGILLGGRWGLNRNLKPGEAKRKGQRIEKRKDWDMVKELFMYEALKAKFSIPELRQKLLDTGKAELFENSPTDAYWGTARNKGQNRLGVLLMMLRDALYLSSLPRL